MYEAAVHDEATSLAGYVDQQLSAIRAAIYGLTEEQAGARPCRSALSVIGIIKHTADGMRSVVRTLANGMVVPPMQPGDVDRYLAGFALAEGETVEAVLTEFDAARRAYVATIGASNPDLETVVPPAAWHGLLEERPIRLRYYLLHQVEEMARTPATRTSSARSSTGCPSQRWRAGGQLLLPAVRAGIRDHRRLTRAWRCAAGHRLRRGRTSVDKLFDRVAGWGTGEDLD